MTWSECETLVKKEISKIKKAHVSDVAAADTYPIRSLEVTMSGYAPLLNPPNRHSRTGRIEDITGVPPEFRLAVTLEHSISLIVSDLIRRYYVDRAFVGDLNKKAVDIKAAQNILLTLKTWVCSYQQQFVRFGGEYAAVRRKCREFYFLWYDERTDDVPPPVKEVVLERYLDVLGVGEVNTLALRLTWIRKMIQTGNLSAVV